MKGKPGTFTFNTAEGCRRTLAVLGAVILVSSFFAYMLACDWGRVKINEISIDAKGSVLQATLYTPRRVSADKKLPAILVTHGMSCTNSTVNGLAEEFARRGFVALSLSAYGSGASETSETPADPTGGIYDALKYMRTLQYVDTTRIGLIGHSQGSQRIAATADIDCSPYTLNDLMINAMCDTFGQTFTNEEIFTDADALAEKRLSKDQLAYYYAIKAEKKDYLDHTVYAILVLGGNWGLNETKVKVGGYEVVRTPNCNACWQIALFNEGRAGTGQANLVNKSMLERFQTADKINIDTWYQVRPYTGEARPESAVLGKIGETSVSTDAALQKALADRSTRIIFTPLNSHARDYFSKDAASHSIKYFEQAFAYNRGSLLDPATVPLDSSNVRFMFREFLNLVALVAMCLALVALSGLLLRTKFFAECKQDACEPFVTKKSGVFWLISLAYAAFTFLVIRFVTQNGMKLGFKWKWAKKFWSMDFTADIHVAFMWLIAIGSLVLLAVFTVYNIRAKKLSIPKELKLVTKPTTVLKYFVMAAILFVGAYVSLATVKYLFHQDFRFWDTGVKDMLPQNFMLCLRYSILILPTFLIGSVFVNSGRMKDMGDGANTAVQMALSCVGLYAACLISYGACYITYWTTGVGTMPSMAFISTWPMLINVPLFAFIARKFYNQTGSVWLGAFVNTSIACWMICSAQSSTTYYLLGNFATKWLGIF